MPLGRFNLDNNPIGGDPVRSLDPIRTNFEKLKGWMQTVEQRLGLVVTQTVVVTQVPGGPPVVTGTDPQPTLTLNGTENFLPKFALDAGLHTTLANSIIQQDAAAAHAYVGGDLALTTDKYLLWASAPATLAASRLAGLRWTTGTTPNELQVDAGTTTRLKIRAVASGTAADLNFSPFKLALPDSATYATAPATAVYRGVDISGTLAIAVTTGTGGANLITTNPGFETWTDSTHCTSWIPSNSPSQVPSRESTIVQSGSFSCKLAFLDNVDGATVNSTNSGSPFSHYIQIQSATDTTLSFTFWLYGNASGTGKNMFWGIYVFTGQTDTAPAFTLRRTGVGEGLGGFEAGDAPPSGTPITVIPQDNLWAQHSYSFTFNPGSLGTTYYVVARFVNAGSTIAGTNPIYVDNVSLNVIGTMVTAPLTLRSLTTDQLTFQPTITGVSDSLTLTELTGAKIVPTLAPSMAVAGTVTVTDIFGLRLGFAYTAPAAGTVNVTNAYSLYAEAPGVSTNAFAGWFNSTTALGAGSAFRFYRTSNAFYTSIAAGAQGANIAYTWQLTAPTVDGAVHTSTIAGQWSWTDPATLITKPSYNHRWAGNGPFRVGTTVDGAWIPNTAFVITSVWIWHGTAGTSSSTILDLNKNGTTMYTTQANRPTINFADADGKVQATLPDVTSIAAGDIITIDIDQVEGGTPRDVILVIQGV